MVEKTAAIKILEKKKMMILDFVKRFNKFLRNKRNQTLIQIRKKKIPPYPQNAMNVIYLGT